MNFDQLRQHGFQTLTNRMEMRYIDDLKTTLTHLITTAQARLSKPQQRALQQALSNQPDTLLHEGMIWLYSNAQREFQYVVDAACNSASIHRLVTNSGICKAISQAIELSSPTDLNITQTRLRVDLPGYFAANKKKMHLGYHQEAGYFTQNVSQRTGVVGWIPLFDCADEDGALRVLQGSHKAGLLPHKHWYEDPVNQRQKRQEVPAEYLTAYPEVAQSCRAGDITLQNFYLVHRSGDNLRQHSVRYTVVSRYSSLVADDFAPISWSAN